jgi:hypothetical protein
MIEQWNAGVSRRSGIGFVLHNPQSDNSAKGGRLLPGAVPEIRNPQFICRVPTSVPSAFKSQVINRNS